MQDRWCSPRSIRYRALPSCPPYAAASSAVPAVIAVPGIGAEFDELPDDVEPLRPDRDPERYAAARVGRVDDARADSEMRAIVAVSPAPTASLKRLRTSRGSLRNEQVARMREGPGSGARVQ